MPKVLVLVLTCLIAAPVAAQPVAAPIQPIRAQAETPSLNAACDRAAPATLAFADEDAFAARLAAALESRPASVTVEAPRPFSPETIPERLHDWLVETARAGGAVTRRDIPCGQAAGASRPVAFGVRAFFARPGTAVNQAVRGYDAVLWLEQATGAVTQVQFVRRPSA